MFEFHVASAWGNAPVSFIDLGVAPATHRCTLSNML